MITRRGFVTASVAAAAVAGLPLDPAHARSTDPIDQLIALSVDAKGHPHIYAVAFLGLDGEPLPSGHVASLPIAPDEGRALAEAFRLRDHRRYHQAGPRVGGRGYVFLLEYEDGAVIWARRDGAGLCIRKTSAGIVVVQSAPGMDQGSANVALWKFTKAPLVG